MPPQPKNLVGQRFGRLVVVEYARPGKRGAGATWLVRCDCGVERVVSAANLRRGCTQSCGCLNRDRTAEAIRKRCTRHGQAKLKRTGTYSTWNSMKNRCDNPRAQDYYLYGARGISVCDRWRDFKNFYADMGEKPAGLTIERIDINGDYEPSNVRWATRAEQTRNTRSNRNLTVNNLTLCVTDWAIKVGVRRNLIYQRLNAGWEIERAIFTPSQRGTRL